MVCPSIHPSVHRSIHRSILFMFSKNSKTFFPIDNAPKTIIYFILNVATKLTICCSGCGDWKKKRKGAVWGQWKFIDLSHKSNWCKKWLRWLSGLSLWICRVRPRVWTFSVEKNTIFLKKRNWADLLTGLKSIGKKQYFAILV